MVESRNGRIYNVMVLFVEILLTGQIWKFEKFVGVGVFQLLDLLSLIFQNRIDSVILWKWPVFWSLRRQGSASLRVLRHGHASHCLVHPESARFWLLGKVLYFVKWLFSSKVSSDLLVKTAVAEEASGVVRHVLITWTTIVAAIRYRTCDPTRAFDKHRLFIFGGAYILFQSWSKPDLLQYIFILMMLLIVFFQKCLFLPHFHYLFLESSSFPLLNKVFLIVWDSISFEIILVYFDIFYHGF